MNSHQLLEKGRVTAGFAPETCPHNDRSPLKCLSGRLLPRHLIRPTNRQYARHRTGRSPSTSQVFTRVLTVKHITRPTTSDGIRSANGVSPSPPSSMDPK
ncbi:hypothetical protein EJ110_NYTH15280 [Nymphaea thermarum]|nr:hypothetical protein EJ110_NYTH15280 [Nymphaea thermarum]